ncbi:hypothetical protein FHU36_005844 [Nonomuraea muscovyensis]|uniref:Uncharacterized protein n=1 Tax=Nonomuraea muscovyensis TaxID=1124761 RepID=A0A7X0C674_9ACTN|nr:hypothetical protein [Nonomuraea muscovyensis]MBB6349299.1 hypothetical protein [Nonomuraea muscovyensis]
MLPRPLAFLAALALSGTTGAVIALLPGRAEPDTGPGSPPAAGSGAAADAARPPGPSAAGGGRSPSPGVGAAAGSDEGEGAPGVGFVAFADAARGPALDLAAHARRTGLRRYAVGHVIAAPVGCAPRWAGPAATSGPSIPGGPAAPKGTAAAEGPEAAGGAAVAFGDLRGRFAELRAEGGEAGLVLGGPAGRGLAGACATTGDLTAAYRRLVTVTGAAFLDFEVSDGADHAAAERRALAVRALQDDLPLRVGFTLPLHPDGLSAHDVELLRLTHRLGVDVTTVNLLAPVEPRERSSSSPVHEVAASWDRRPETGASGGRLRRVASAVRAARDQIADAQGLADAREAARRLALTPVLTGPHGLSEADARRLAAFADRHGLAWLSLRGTPQNPAVARILWRIPA